MTIGISRHIKEILSINNMQVNSNYKKDKRKYIGILNLMPNKIETEIQLLNLLNYSDEDLKVDFIRVENSNKKSSYYNYVIDNYKLFDEIKYELDGIIITGAPVEKLDFDDVRYSNELRGVLEFCKNNIKSSLHICWGAQFALNHYYGIKKIIENKKIFGVFNHEIVNKDIILNNIINGFSSPHSRYTSLDKLDVENNKEVKVIARSNEGFEHILKGMHKDYYILGHCEYTEDVLKKEYLRDLKKGIITDIPKNYFINNDISNKIIFNWQNTARNIYKNWIEQI